MKKYICLVCLLGLTVSTSATAQRAIPKLTGPVVDQAGILSDRAERQLAGLIMMHEDSTSNQIAVLTVPSLDGEVLEEYSLRVGRTWALGQADKNNGVLFLIAVTERKIRIEVGYGLEGDLPDITAKRIIDNEMTPYFRKGDFDAGVVQGVRTTMDAIEGSYTPSANSAFMETIGSRLLAGFLVMIVPFFLLGFSLLWSRTAFWVVTLFTAPFMGGAGFLIFPPYGALILPLVIILSLLMLRRKMRGSEKWRGIIEAIAKAKPGDTVPIVIKGKTYNYTVLDPSTASSSGGDSSSGWSSSGGFSGGGGSFSGGGGSFGGGGASGGW